MTVLRGDVNQDNLLNVADIVMLINFILDTITLSEKQEVIVDMNDDDIINVLDVLQLVDIILNN